MIYKKYLEEYYPIKYNELIMNGTIMNVLVTKEKELYKYAETLEKQFKEHYPKPTGKEFIVHAKYNNFIKSMVDEFVIAQINEIRLES